LQILASFRRGLLGFAGLASHSGRSTIPFRVLRSGTVEFPFQLNQPREQPYPHPADPISGQTTPDKQQSIRKKTCTVKSSSRKTRGNLCGKSQQNRREDLERIEYSTNSAQLRNPGPGGRLLERVADGQGCRNPAASAPGGGADPVSFRRAAGLPEVSLGRTRPLARTRGFSLSNSFIMST
jgi:hypothetical protein